MVEYSMNRIHLKGDVTMNCKVIFLGFLGVLPSLAMGAADLARVNGRVITDQDMRGALSGYTEGQRKNILKDPNTRREILSGLIDQELLTQTGLKEKVDQSLDFKATIDQFRRQYISQILLNRNVDPQLTESALKKYYEKHKFRYNTDQVHVQHLLVADESQAQEMLKRVKDPQVDFQTLCEKFSRDPSAKNNRGDLGFIDLNSPYVDEFKDAAFSGLPGEVVGPIKTLYGYHLIKIVEKKIGKTIPYDEIELRVKNELQRALRNQYIQKLRTTASILVDSKALEKMQ